MIIEFFFMRGFPDLESRGPMKDQFYEGELWKRELEHKRAVARRAKLT